MALKAAGMILAAGLGTRLKPLSDLRPKALMEIGGQSIISYLIDKLLSAGIEDIYINLYYKSDLIINYIKNLHTTANINFSEEEQLLGTAGGLRRVLEKFNLCDRSLVLIHGDIWCDADLKALLEQEYYAGLVCIKDRLLEGYSGSIACDEAHNIVELGRYYKSSKLSCHKGFFSGIHMLSEGALNDVRMSDKSCLIGELYPQWLHSNKNIKAYMTNADYDDLGSLKRLWQRNLKIIKNHNVKNIIHPRARVENGVFIDGVVIGADAYVKKGAHIKNSVIMSQTVIEKDEQLDCALALLKARVFLNPAHT
jgi:NDP-sugar pyrophosphorylase family protein